METQVTDLLALTDRLEEGAQKVLVLWEMG